MTQLGEAAPSALLQKLQTSTGKYAMLALDQRESMRGMFDRLDDGEFVGDESLRSFKRLALELLTPYASAVLVDRPFGLGDSRPKEIAQSCGLIVAVDVLHQRPGKEITDVSLDELVTVDYLHRVGADAVKLLVLWHARSGKDERRELVERVIELASDASVASLIEGIVRPEPGQPWASRHERHEAILACAEELSGFSPDIYKAEVPGYSPGDVSLVAEQSRRLSEIVGMDWVVLSSGVAKEDFAAAVTEAVAGGASGFLAGRAIWADAVAEPDQAAAMRARSIDRLTALTDIVDRGN